MKSYKLGDTVTLSTTYSVAGVLTDPTTVSLLVEAPDGTQQTYTYAGATVTKDSTGTYHKDYSPASLVGVYTYQWTGTGTAAGVEQGQFTVIDLLALHGADLCTVGRVKDWIGDVDSSQDSRIAQLVTAASRAVMEYSQREFAPVSAAATRHFALKRDGLVTFGKYDLQSASAVTIDAEAGGSPTTLTSDLYQLRPVDAPHGVYNRLAFYTFAIGPILRQYVGGLYRDVSVTGTWGFASVPADVEQATIITAAKWFKRDQVAWSNEMPTPSMSDGYNLPFDARMLLQPYKRVV